jgi:2-polyprenyl-6-hydroxyphenyl methylase/3-demethylubiquinone-9 3-methyltransferase
MVYNPLTQEYSLKDQDVDVNYLVATRREDA